MIGVLFLTLGAFNAILALTVETCTQGAADSLSGGFITLALYLAGILALLVSKPSRAILIALLPAAVVAAWHSWFSLRFFLGYWLDGVSACAAMNGAFNDEARYWDADGDEPMLTVLWLGLSLIFWAGIAAYVRLARKSAS